MTRICDVCRENQYVFGVIIVKPTKDGQGETVGELRICLRCSVTSTESVGAFFTRAITPMLEEVWQTSTSTQSNSESDDQLHTLKEVADKLGMGLPSVSRAAKNNRLKTVTRVTPAALEEYRKINRPGRTGKTKTEKR